MVSKRIVLRFPGSLVEKPIVYSLVKEYNLRFNILQAKVTPDEEGLLVLELSGRKEDYEKGMKYLAEAGVEVQPLSRDVRRNETRCTHCGACVVICPSAALFMKRPSMEVVFDSAKCIACEICVKACPPRAMEVRF
jgi:ferredoxin